MGTNYIAPTWRMPRNANKDKLSNYSIEFGSTTDDIRTDSTWITDLGLNGANKLSVSIWLKPTSSTTIMSATSSPYNNYNDNFNIRYDASNTSLLFIGGNNASTKFSNNSVTLTINEWHHVVFVFDATAGSTAAARARCWVNNSEIANQATNLWLNIPDQSNRLYIGRRVYGAGGGTNQWVGEISQVCIFDYELTDGTGGTTNQIGYLYNLNNPMAITGGEPVAYWPLGDNSNPNAPGSFPNISVGADSVFNFNGSTSKVVTDETLTTLGVSTEFTISTWFNSDNLGLYDTIIVAPSGPVVWDAGFGLSIVNSKLRFWINQWNDSASFIDSITLSPNTWYHAVGTFNSATGIKLYLNAGTPGTNTQTTLDGLTNIISIGASLTSYYFDGEITNIQIWNKELIDSEVETLYNNGQPLMTGTQPQEDNLQAWYKLNQSANYDEGQLVSWTISKVGNPNYGGTNDGCYSLNPGLRWHDNNYATVGSNYFQWNSPAYKTSGNNIVLSSTGGQTATPFFGSELILEYSIDGGPWTLWFQKTTGQVGSTPVPYTIPSTGNLTVNNFIKVRAKGVDEGGTGSLLDLYNIQISGGTFSYNENFNESQRYGFFANNGVTGLQPPIEYNPEPVWQIPDNRSAYPQSFDFNGLRGADGNPKQEIIATNVPQSQNFTFSCWANFNNPTVNLYHPLVVVYDGSTSVIELIKYRSASNSNQVYFTVRNTSNNRPIVFSNVVPTANEWCHVAGTYDGSNITIYFNGTPGQSLPLTGDTIAAGPIQIGSYYYWNTVYGSNFDGQISNVQYFDTALPATGSNSIETLYNNGVPLTTAIAYDNLKAWYKLDNNEIFDGTNWSVNNQKYPAGFDSALDFDRTQNDNVFIGSPSAIQNLTNITLSVWVKVPNTFSTPYYTVASKGEYAASGSQWYLTIKTANSGPGGTFLIYKTSDSTSGTAVNYTTNIDDNLWHNIVCINDGTDLKVYIDGQLDGINAGNGGNIYNGNRDLKIGRLTASSTRNFDGLMSNMVIWGDSQETEISNIYNNGTPATSYTNTPIAWWKLNNTTTGIQDSAGSNNGTNNGATKLNTFVSTEAGTSSGMTEQNLVNNNVSVLNGESVDMNSTNLVTSNISRTQPFSSYSTKFDGIEYYTDTGGGFLNGATTASVSVWMKMETIPASGQYQPVISCWGTSPLNQYLIRYRTGNGFEFYLGGPVGASTSFVVARSTVTAVANTWYNVVGTWDGSEVKIYVNGAFGGSEIATSGSLNSSTQPNLVGRYSATNMDGYISNTAFWTDTVLSEDDILNIYNNGITQDLNNFRVPPTNWFPLDESYTYFNGSVMVARDVISGGELDGVNVVQSDIVGNAPGSQSNGAGSNFVIGYLEGNMKDSKLNAFSINMADYADGVTNPANSGRSTDTP